MTKDEMFLLIAGIVVIIVGLGIALLAPETIAKVGGVALAIVLGGGMLIFSSAYTQEVGEAKVIKNFDGTIEREDVTAGLDWKAPWQDAVDFDITGQQAIYKGNGQATSDGEKVNGPEITAQDKDGVSSNIDVAIRYSVKPDSVSEIFSVYKSQENFVARLIDQDIRSVVRNIPSTYSTVDVLAKRSELESKIVEGLKARWEKQGVVVDSVALQGIRYPQVVQDRFTDAQNAKTQVVQEQAKLESTKISAQQRIVEAEAQAEANRKLAASLTPEVLQSQQLSTLEKLGASGNVFVVPNGSNPLITVDKK
jgi:regulator of protease activity HflC (stomatin/prohibitin superfamily)